MIIGDTPVREIMRLGVIHGDRSTRSSHLLINKMMEKIQSKCDGREAAKAL
jgi:hypothetical protein